MKYSIFDTYERSWHDDILCVYWQPKGFTKNYLLSKQKMLKYFSKLKQITALHMLLLDNLSSITSFYFYVDENKLIIISKQNFQRIQLEINAQVIDQIIENCTIEEV